MTENPKCPSCGGWLLQRYGKTKAGLQKFRCVEPHCRRQFVAGSEHLIDPKKKAIIMALLSQDTPPKKIAAAVPGISMRWIYELRVRARR